MGVYRVWHTRHLLTIQQGTLLRLRLQPMAASHKVDALVFDHTTLLLPYRGGEIVARTTSRQEPTMVALTGEVTTAQRDMTDGRGWPDIVHRPHHRLAATQYLTDATQGEHTLIDPVEVDDVGLLEFTQAGDVGTRIGNIHLKEMSALKAEPTEDDQPLPKKAPAIHGRLRKTDHRQGVGILIAHQHLGLDTIINKCHHQTVCSYSCPTRPVACIDDQYSHTAKVVKTE